MTAFRILEGLQLNGLTLKQKYQSTKYLKLLLAKVPTLPDLGLI